MFFFRKERTPKGQDRPVNTVKLYLGDYYRDYGEPYSGRKNLLCAMPYHEDGDPSFRNLARSLGAEFLSEFPFVVEQLLGGHVQRSQRKGPFRKSDLEPVDLLQETYISEYQKQGGQVRCREKNDLTVLSEFDGPKLLPLIPIGSLAAPRIGATERGKCPADGPPAAQLLVRKHNMNSAWSAANLTITF